MKSIWFFIFLLNNLFFIPSFAHHSEFSELDSSGSSVWKIFSFEKNIQNPGMEATGFFIGPNHFIANFHFLDLVLNMARNSTGIALSQEWTSLALKVKKVLVVSALYDLVLFKTEGNVTKYLSLIEYPPEPSTSAFFITYPDGISEETIKKVSFFSEDTEKYTLSFDSSLLEGRITGGPVLDPVGQLVGVISSVSGNMLKAVKISYLREFINGDTGTRCANSNLNTFSFSIAEACVKKELENLKN